MAPLLSTFRVDFPSLFLMMALFSGSLGVIENSVHEASSFDVWSMRGNAIGIHCPRDLSGLFRPEPI
jgi:hypothetical protein